MEYRGIRCTLFLGSSSRIVWACSLLVFSFLTGASISLRPVPVGAQLLQTLREKFQAPWDAETGGSSNSEVGENETEDDGGEESHSGSSGSEDEEEDSDGGGAAKRRKLKEEKKKAFDNAYDKKGSDGEEDEDVEGSEFLRSQEQRKQKQALVNAAEFEEEDPNIRARVSRFSLEGEVFVPCAVHFRRKYWSFRGGPCIAFSVRGIPAWSVRSSGAGTSALRVHREPEW